VTVHEYIILYYIILYRIIPHVLVFRQHNGDDPPQDYKRTPLLLMLLFNYAMQKEFTAENSIQSLKFSVLFVLAINM